jgi:serine-aspartate repeat-containing protein C/D/E
VGIINWMKRLSGPNRKRATAMSESDRPRVCRFEDMEPRLMMAAAPIHLGGVYVEADSGGDHHGDRFEIMFSGGAPGTQLTRLEINGDQLSAGLGFGDMIFDTVRGGLGSDDAYAFQVVSSAGIDQVTAHVNDGGTQLVLDLQGFHAGEKLVFSIDVDEVQDYDASVTDLELINQGIDPIASGVEFQGSLLQAAFSAPHFVDAQGSAEFRNVYDSLFQGTNLLISDEQPNGLPNDDFQQQRDRSTGTLVTVGQVPLPISISGKVFLDRDENLAQAAAEPGIAGVQLSLWKKNGSAYVDSGFTTTTDAEGNYRFGRELGLTPGTYQVRELQPIGYLNVGAIVGKVAGVVTGNTVANEPNVLTEIDIPWGDTDATHYDFAEVEPGSISGRVFADADEDCQFNFNGDDKALKNIKVHLYNAAGEYLATSITDDDGNYLFSDLRPGVYEVREEQPENYLQGGQVAGSGGGDDSQIDVISRIPLSSGNNHFQYDFCEIAPASLSGFVHVDQDGDCLFDSNEPALSGVEVQLLDAAGSIVATTTTASNGAYRFTQLRPGVYSVRETQPTGYLQAGQMTGSAGGDATQTDILSQIPITAGAALTDYNFCEYLPASISGYVHIDTIMNCLFDAGEQPLENITVELLSADGTVLETTTTNAEGLYRFDSLLPGEYTVRETQPTGYFEGGQLAGSGGGNDANLNRIEHIPLASGAQLTDYNFCELQPSTLSGFVFRDGVPLVTTDGLPPVDLQTVRDGKLSADDERLAGVTVELWFALEGRPVTSDDVLPGTAPEGPLRTVTDANGYYEFKGLPQGVYAVVQSQPDRYFDGLDTPGTTGGIPLNPHTEVDANVISPLINAGVKLNYDAIVRIGLGYNAHSQENNFSEILVEKAVEKPPVDPPKEDEKTIIPSQPLSLDRPGLTPLAFSLGSQAPAIPIIIQPVTPPEEAPQGHDGGAPAWHLSVVNGGTPRGDKSSYRLDAKAQLRPAKMLDLAQWKALRLNAGQWLLPSTPGTAKQEIDYGLAGAQPLSGDFNGDGRSELVLYHEGDWFIDLNGNVEWDEGDLWAQLGSKQDRPVVGDWDGDGKDDIGVFGTRWMRDPIAVKHEAGLPDVTNQTAATTPKNPPPQPEHATDGVRHMQATTEGKTRTDHIDHVFFFGSHNSIPVVGDFNGDGIDTIATFNSGVWQFDANGDGRYTTHDRSANFGEQRDIPLVGDFDGDGVDEIAVYRQGELIIDSNHNGQIDDADQRMELGRTGDIPVIGDFNGDGIDEAAIYRSGAIADTARVPKR